MYVSYQRHWLPCHYPDSFRLGKHTDTHRTVWPIGLTDHLEHPSQDYRRSFARASSWSVWYLQTTTGTGTRGRSVSVNFIIFITWFIFIFMCKMYFFSMYFFSLLITHFRITIGLSRKFVPILKENWNAEDLNFSIHLLNLNLLRHELSGQSNILRIRESVSNWKTVRCIRCIKNVYIWYIHSFILSHVSLTEFSTTRCIMLEYNS